MEKRVGAGAVSTGKAIVYVPVIMQVSVPESWSVVVKSTSAEGESCVDTFNVEKKVFDTVLVGKKVTILVDDFFNQKRLK